MKLILATRNMGKVKELTTMLKVERERKKINILTLQDFPNAPEVIEDGDTYQENAAKKATVIAGYTGIRTLADDAGLEVDALNGEPGVHSKRWAGEKATDADRIKKMLEALDGVEDRTARFVAAIAIVEPNVINTNRAKHLSNFSYVNSAKIVVGKCEGHIGHAPAGTAGFGYDPIFVPKGYQKSFAELGEEVKNRISHRAHALKSALKLL